MASAAAVAGKKLPGADEFFHCSLHGAFSKVAFNGQSGSTHLSLTIAIRLVRNGQQDNEGAIDGARMRPHPVDDNSPHVSKIQSPGLADRVRRWAWSSD